MTNLTDNDVFDAAVDVPDNGETVIAASANNPPALGEGPVRPAFQKLSNRSRYNKNRTDETWAGTRSLKGLRLTNGAGQVVTAPAGSLVVSKITQAAPAGAAPKTVGTEAGELTLGLVPMARGRILPNGTILRGIGIYDVTHTIGSGIYVITLTRAPTSVDNFDVTLGMMDHAVAPSYTFGSWYEPAIAAGRITFKVHVYGTAGPGPFDEAFSFVAWGE